MICNNKYIYKIELVTSADVLEFVRIATKCSYHVWLVNGNRRLNAKSVLGVAMARVSWDEIFVESEFNCYFEFEKFIR
ncbi:MAG: HPr family phosphocarrier protein [Clostridia bacterium]|nr:HPr family phosphocarrier protein [Clostridia bacterium]